jgi:putative hydrolase of the HAD superfamily
LRSRFHELDGAGYNPRATVFEHLAADFSACGPAQPLVDDWHAHAFDRCVYNDGAVEILAWCRDAGFRTGIITNGRSIFQRGKIANLGVTPLVDQILVSGEESIAKPEAELFHRAAERLGVVPTDCVFIGDNPHIDIAGATSAGMHAIWIESDLAWPDGPRPAHSIRHLNALRYILRRPERA